MMSSCCLLRTCSRFMVLGVYAGVVGMRRVGLGLCVVVFRLLGLDSLKSVLIVPCFVTPQALGCMFVLLLRVGVVLICVCAALCSGNVYPVRDLFIVAMISSIAGVHVVFVIYPPVFVSRMLQSFALVSWWMDNKLVWIRGMCSTSGSLIAWSMLV